MSDKLPLKINVLARLDGRCGITEAAKRHVSLLHDICEEVQESKGAPFMHPVVYHHAMPDPVPPLWMAKHHVIAYWVCESSVAAASYKAAADVVTQIWTASEASAQAIRALGSKTPVFVIPHPMPLPEVVPDRSGRKTITTLYAFAPPMERKNVETLIRLWKEAFQGQKMARLILKCRGSNPALKRLLELLTESDKRIELITQDLPEEEMQALYARADIFASAHRAGAFELHIAEAAAWGLPIVCTDVGGVKDYLHDECAQLVDGLEIPPLAECPMNRAGVWIEPDHASFVEDLKELTGDAALRLQLGKAARENVGRVLSVERVAGLMREALAQVVDLPAKKQPITKMPAAAEARTGLPIPVTPMLRPIRSGLEVMGRERQIPAAECPVILSHRRSGTHLLGELVTRHWGCESWLKSHDWPERRPLGHQAVYVLRNPLDTLYATWTWWRSEGGAKNRAIAEVMDDISFEAWLHGDAGRIMGYQSWRDAKRDNLEVSRGQMFDPIRYWRDHWRAAAEAGIPIILFEDLVNQPEVVTDVLHRTLGREPKTALKIIKQAVGLAPDPESHIGFAKAHWPAWELARLGQLLSPDLMRGIGRADLRAWLNEAPKD